MAWPAQRGDGLTGDRSGSARRRRRLTLAYVCLGALLTAGSSAAKTPLPAVAAGPSTMGKPAAGLLLGKRFTALAAIAQRDFYGTLNVYLFAARRGCGTITAADAPYVGITVDTGGHAIAVGKRIASTKGVLVAAAVANRAALATRPALIGRGVSITFTHLDPRVGSVWRGSVRIASRSNRRVAGMFKGAFAARWCGEG